MSETLDTSVKCNKEIVDVDRKYTNWRNSCWKCVAFESVTDYDYQRLILQYFSSIKGQCWLVYCYLTWSL